MKNGGEGEGVEARVKGVRGRVKGAKGQDCIKHTYHHRKYSIEQSERGLWHFLDGSVVSPVHLSCCLGLLAQQSPADHGSHYIAPGPASLSGSGPCCGACLCSRALWLYPPAHPSCEFGFNLTYTPESLFGRLVECSCVFTVEK